MTIEAHIFRADALGDTKVFRIPQLHTSPVFFTEELAELIRRSELVGVGYRLLWDEQLAREGSPSNPFKASS
jgi:hypothetical protein